MDDFEITWKNIDTNEEFKFTVHSFNKITAADDATEILTREGQNEVAEIITIKLISFLGNKDND